MINSLKFPILVLSQLSCLFLILPAAQADYCESRPEFALEKAQNKCSVDLDTYDSCRLGAAASSRRITAERDLERVVDQVQTELSSQRRNSAHGVREGAILFFAEAGLLLAPKDVPQGSTCSPPTAIAIDRAKNQCSDHHTKRVCEMAILESALQVTKQPFSNLEDLTLRVQSSLQRAGLPAEQGRQGAILYLVEMGLLKAPIKARADISQTQYDRHRPTLAVVMEQAKIKCRGWRQSYCDTVSTVINEAAAFLAQKPSMPEDSVIIDHLRRRLPKASESTLKYGVALLLDEAGRLSTQ